MKTILYMAILCCITCFSYAQRNNSEIDTSKTFDQDRPFLVNGNGGNGSKLIYHSAFSGYVEGYGGTYYIGPATDKGRKCYLINCPIPRFFQFAYGMGSTKFLNPNRVIFNVNDSGKLTSNTRGNPFIEWKRQGNAFCYELSVPPHLTDKFFNIMKEDLRRFFPQYGARVEKRTITCMALIRLSSDDKLKSTDNTAKPEAIFNGYGGKLRNTYLHHFISRLQILYQQLSPTPFIDETGYKGKVDLEINAKLSDVNDMNRELEKYGLKFVEMEKELEMLVIRDTPPGN